MNDRNENLARSLSADSIDLIPYLPYLLQDIWELGSSAQCIGDLLQEYVPVSSSMRMLDLACGKGAVSIHIARTLGCHLKGIDIIPEFIHDAQAKARQYQVEDRCEFVVGDIHDAIDQERGYDIVLCGATGDLLGDPLETILALQRTIHRAGYIIIDDVYGRPGSPGIYPTREEWLGCFRSAGVSLLAERIAEPGEIVQMNEKHQTLIRRRATELMLTYPNSAELFERYMKSQQDECDALEHDVIGVTMILVPDSSL